MSKDMASLHKEVMEKHDVESQESIEPFGYDEKEEKAAVWKLDVVLIPV